MADQVATLRLLLQEEVSSKLGEIKQQLEQFQASTNKTRDSLSGFDSVARTAFGVALGQLGVASIGQIIQTLSAFGQATLAAGADMQLLTNRASVLFGQDFPAAMQGIQGMA